MVNKILTGLMWTVVFVTAMLFFAPAIFDLF